MAAITRGGYSRRSTRANEGAPSVRHPCGVHRTRVVSAGPAVSCFPEPSTGMHEDCGRCRGRIACMACTNRCAEAVGRTLGIGARVTTTSRRPAPVAQVAQCPPSSVGRREVWGPARARREGNQFRGLECAGPQGRFAPRGGPARRNKGTSLKWSLGSGGRPAQRSKVRMRLQVS